MARTPNDLSRKRKGHRGIERQLKILAEAIHLGGRLGQFYPEKLRGMLLKQEGNLAAYQGIEQSLRRDYENDRQFPMETVMLQSHNLKHGTNIDKAIVHVGPYADELARSAHSAALTIGAHIFFRNGAYKPETEEGRKTKAHELAHVAQYEEGRTGHNADRETLEREADLAEGMEEYDDDPIVVLNVNGNRYRFSKSKEKYYAHKLTEKIEEWVSEQSIIRDEKEYLKLLVSYQRWRGERT